MKSDWLTSHHAKTILFSSYSVISSFSSSLFPFVSLFCCVGYICRFAFFSALDLPSCVSFFPACMFQPSKTCAFFFLPSFLFFCLCASSFQLDYFEWQQAWLACWSGIFLDSSFQCLLSLYFSIHSLKKEKRRRKWKKTPSFTLSIAFS